MVIGAALRAVYTLLVLAQAEAFRRWSAERNPSFSPRQVETAARGTLLFFTLFSVFAFALWLILAFACRNGRHGARVLAFFPFIIFVGINLLQASGATRSVPLSSSTTMVTALEALAGLTALLLLWIGPSTVYFKARRAR